MTKTYTHAEMVVIKEAAFSDGKLHRTPSPETMNMFAKMEETLQEIRDELAPISAVYNDTTGFAHVVKWLVVLLLGASSVIAAIKVLKIW